MVSARVVELLDRSLGARAQSAPAPLLAPLEANVNFDRSAGMLLHVSSLPGPCGIGDLGLTAHHFVDFLAAAGQSYWQILPLGPNDAGNPYVAESSWAGSPFFVSLEQLKHQGDLTDDELRSAMAPHRSEVDYRAVRDSRRVLLARAAERFLGRAKGKERDRYDTFCQAEASWLEDWALFGAAHRHFEGKPWWEWPRPLALRTAAGLKEWKEKLAKEMDVERYVQMRFYEQWELLRAKAASSKIKLIGDIPIYCARDSTDVWANRQYFQLKEDGTPKVVSGVPPDYFAKDGQLWGTPIYDWKKLAAEGFGWWIGRLRAALRQADVVRIDHFRAFEAYWEVKANAPTARDGRWVKGPGDAFFHAVRKALGEAPFIAEDLGIITKEVRALRDRFELPGMRVLQFAFSEGAASPHLPIHYSRSSVVYTGTHDNDTTVGWYQKASEKEKDAFRRYTSTDGNYCHYHMMRAAYSSVADLAIVPAQDVLGLGTAARINVPGVADGNWKWKLVPDQLGTAQARTLGELCETFGRLPGKKPAAEGREEGAAA